MIGKKTKILVPGVLLLVFIAWLSVTTNKDEVSLKTKNKSKTEIIETIKKPDGEIITRRIIKKEKNKSSFKQITQVKKDWFIGVSSTVLSPEPTYSISVDRRIVGDVYIGGYVTTKKEVGISIKVSF